MHIVKIRCSHCTARFRADADRYNGTCPYCGLEVDMQQDAKSYIFEEPVPEEGQNSEKQDDSTDSNER